MGCDIHVYLEVKKHINDIEEWVSADLFKLNPYYPGDEEDCEQQYEICHAYRNRDYELFATLADVRNYNGIAPISEPKGMPDDCCQMVINECRRWGGDGHSHSYFTLRELQQYADSKIKTKYQGYMSQEEAEKVDKGEMPTMWCGWANEKLGFVYREWEYEDNILDSLISSMVRRVHETHWLNEEYLKENPDKLRMVFWFDN